MHPYLITLSVLIVLGTLLFIYFRFIQKYDPYLSIVNGESVATQTVPKYQFKFVYSAYNPVNTFDPNNSQDITNYITKIETAVSPMGEPSTGISGADKKLFIYNIGPDVCEITGVSLLPVPDDSVIKLSVQESDETKPAKEYKGAGLSLNPKAKIIFDNINSYTLNRLMLSVNNRSDRNLYVYFTDGPNYVGIRLSISTGILNIDLFKQ